MNLLDSRDDVELIDITMELELEIERLFRKKEKLTLTEIKQKLLEQKFIYSDKTLNLAMDYLFIRRGIITKCDFWDHESIYTRLDKHRELSSYSKHYYSFVVDNCETKKFLLIADTHIGNEEIEDFKMLDHLYDYAINEGATKCFHLGDLFTGNIGENSLNVEDKREQIKRFVDNYPAPNKSEMVTYGLLGNNDLEIDNMLWHDGFSDIYYDLRELLFVNPSFYMFPRERWCTSFLDKSFQFSHKFYHSMLIHDLKITSEKDIIKNINWLDSNYDVHISGHLHNGFIYGAGPSKFVDKDQLFLSVPATGKPNINKAIAYLITLNYIENKFIPNMDISVLTCDNNYNIKEIDNLTWNFNGHNDINKKINTLKNNYII